MQNRDSQTDIDAQNEWKTTFKNYQRNSRIREVWSVRRLMIAASVTEEEIYNGILAADNTDTACYWFKRTLQGLAEKTGDATARRYMDIAGGKPDEQALKLLTKLK